MSFVIAKKVVHQAHKDIFKQFYSHPCLTFMKRAILTLREKHNIKNKWSNIQVQNKSTSVERY